MGRVIEGLKHAWNAFSADEDRQKRERFSGYGGSSVGYSRPHQMRSRISNEKSLVNSIYNRMAIDVATTDIKHVRTENGRYVSDIRSGLNDCLTVSPNLDQGPRAFLQDAARVMFHEGVAALVPVETTEDPERVGSWDIDQLRVGKITEWMPRHVRVSVYDDKPEYGYAREVILEKRLVGICENPFYDVMNEPNSALQRLIHKLRLLDDLDEDVASNKLNLVLQFPYTIKSESRRSQAQQRLSDLESQLSTSRHGIVYTDGTEKITQLNRAIENNIAEQIPDLRASVMDTLSITKEILNGSATEETMLNYTARTIEPILDTIAEEIIRKFLTKTARTQGQTIMYFKNPFKLIPLSKLAEVSDVFSRNEILSPNELRMGIGMAPSTDPNADKLNNSNMPGDSTLAPTDGSELPEAELQNEDDPAGDAILSSLDVVDSQLTEVFHKLDIEDEGENLNDEVSAGVEDLELEIDDMLKELGGEEEDDDA